MNKNILTEYTAIHWLLITVDDVLKSQPKMK